MGWTEFSKDTEDVVVIVWLREGEDSLVLDIGVRQSGDVEPSIVAYVNEVLCTRSAKVLNHG